MLGALRDSFTGSDLSVAKCFEPRHGVTASDPGAPRLLVCFACKQAEVRRDDERATRWIGRQGQERINRLQRERGVPIGD